MSARTAEQPFPGAMPGRPFMSKETDGIWKAEFREADRRGDPDYYVVVALSGTDPRAKPVVADTRNCDSTFSVADQEANARLLAASPDLLATVKECRSVLWTLFYPDSIRQSSVHQVWAQVLATEARCRAIIAKAERP